MFCALLTAPVWGVAVFSLRYFDHILTGAIAALIALTPLAIGSVHRWAFVPTELVALSLVILWMAKVWVSASRDTRAATMAISPSVFLMLAAPAFMFGGLILFQLMPLPPALLAVVSPATYKTYAKALPGWPHTFPYSASVFAAHAKSGAVPGSGEVLLPSVREVQRGSPIPFLGSDNFITNATAATAQANDKALDESLANSRPGRLWSWYPLAIASSVTWAALLKFVAYASVFFVVLGFPFADESGGEKRFCRLIVVTIVASGLVVALLGLAERVYWNDKILWFFVPQDWGGARGGSLPRAAGPFVNPDHFANYLAMVFPVALAVAFYGLPRNRKRRGASFGLQILGGAAALVIFTAILLSLSRAGWIEAAACSLIFWFVWLTARESDCTTPVESVVSNRAASKPDSWRQHFFHVPRLWRAGLAIAGFSLLVVFALTLVGPQGRTQSNERLQQTVSNGGLGARPRVWHDSLRMVRDFPLLGVGLGNWPESFAHYQTGEWSPYYFREAHNDYVQFLAETGLIGVLALAWFFGVVATKFWAARKGLRAEERPLFIALCLSIGVMAFGECFDFSLHIPANAFLFTLLLALAVRMAASGAGDAKALPNRRHAMITSGAVAAIALILMGAAVVQNGRAYPYDLSTPATLAAARAQVLSHPVSYRTHMSLIALAGDRMDLSRRGEEIAAAVWLDPSNPYLRDMYATSLMRAGKLKESFGQITQSVFDSPTAGTHFYLDRRFVPWLVPAERDAVEQGFRDAVAAHYPGAVAGFATFYDALGRFPQEARLYAGAATSARRPRKRAAYLIAAAYAALKAENQSSAESFLRRAIKAAPSDARPYEDLIVRIYGPEKDLRAAQATTNLGIRNGADPARLYLVLSTAARASGNKAVATSAILKALAYQPSFSMVMRVGRFYSEYGEYDRAVAMFRRAIEINPESAQAFHFLGVAEERDYQYPAADKAYAMAARLAPRQYHEAYVTFQRRMAAAQTRS